MLTIAINPTQYISYINTDVFTQQLAAVDSTLQEFEMSGMWFVVIFYF